MFFFDFLAYKNKISISMDFVILKIVLNFSLPVTDLNPTENY